MTPCGACAHLREAPPASHQELGRDPQSDAFVGVDPAMRWVYAGAMEREELLARISIDPSVCFGRPCIRGRRVWVSQVLELLSTGAEIEEVLEEFDLTEDDVRAAVAYAAEMARFVELPLDDGGETRGVGS